MTQKEQVHSLLQENSDWLCDDCIAELSAIPQRQTTNRYCRELFADALIKRELGACSRCKRDKIVSRI